MKFMISLSLCLLFTTSAHARIECLTDPKRGNVCRVLGGVTCPKGGIMSFVEPVENMTQLFGSYNQGKFSYHPPPGWKFVPGPGYAEFTKYKKKAKITVHQVTPDTLVCSWHCDRSRDHDSYVTGYCGTAATRS
jgi:hypothetical protein